MMHDMSLTEKHVIFYDLPVTFDSRQAVEMTVPREHAATCPTDVVGVDRRVRIPDPISARQPRGAGTDRRFPYSWNPKYPARIGVMPRDGDNSDVRWFDVEPCYVFHPMNAYDDGDTVVARRRAASEDVRRPSISGPTKDRRRSTAGPSTSPTARFANRRVDDRGQEFPRVDERLVGKRHRYGYAPTVGVGTSGNDVLLKHDFVGGGALGALLRGG